jgi:hypothetical protein
VKPDGESELVEIGVVMFVGREPWLNGSKAPTIVEVVVVEMSTGVPSKSGTSVCVGPAAGGGIGRPPFASVVVVAGFTVVVVVVVDVVVVGTVGSGSTAVVLVVVGVVGTCAVACDNPITDRDASAPKQTETTRRTRAS